MQKLETTIEKYESNLILKQAITEMEIEAALKLRFEVFNLELSEGLQSSYQTGLDMDEYDDYCDHIIVMDTTKDVVVGTYRLLPGYRAENGIGYYSEVNLKCLISGDYQEINLNLEGPVCIATIGVLLCLTLCGQGSPNI